MAETYSASTDSADPKVKEMATNTHATAAGRYAKLAEKREPYLKRAREAASFTIPTLLMAIGANGTTDVGTPWQGLGARGLNNLASKLLLALFPTGSPFFRMQADEKALKAEEALNPDFRDEIEEGLAEYEMVIHKDMEGQALRVKFGEALKHLPLAGNVLLYFPPEGGAKVFPLTHYVVKRDSMGALLEIVTCESVAILTLPKEAQELVAKECDTKDYSSEVELNTWVVIQENGSWIVTQEVKGIKVSSGKYAKDLCPWLALRFHTVDGEDYGRGYVEEYIGDLRSLDGLTQAVVEMSAAAAKCLFLVDPGGMTKVEALARAPNGGFVSGRDVDVKCLQINKYNDLQIAEQTISRLESRLSFAFLLNSSIQRGGERVTAEEIKYMARELEDAISGIYSVLTQELQLPLVRIQISRLEKQKKLPALPKNIVSPTIITGLDALGRNHELEKLSMALSTVGQVFGPEAVAQNIKVPNGIKRIFTNAGVNPKGLQKTDDELAQEAQQAQLQAAASTLGPNVVNQVGGLVKERIKQQGNNQPNGQQEAPAATPAA